MTIKQSRYITADTTGKKEMAIRTTELDKVKDDPFVRKSEVQQTVNNSTLPVSSRAVKSAINNIEIPSLDGYATEDYVDEELESVNSRVGLVDEKATEAKAKADRAEQAVSNTVGSGRFMREGAYGIGTISLPQKITGSDKDSFNSGFFGTSNWSETGSSSNGPLPTPSTYTGIRSSSSSSDIKYLLTSNATYKRVVIYYPSEEKAIELYTEANTAPDKNGILHKGTETPLDTLNTSDMADTVVDNDKLTVTSGAVFRAIKQLTDQITSLEARVRELEDGGV